MNSNYIVFRSSDETQIQALWWVGIISHADVWRFFKEKNREIFTTALSAGQTCYDNKTKKFITFGHSTTLNLVPHDTDPEVLLKSFTKNNTLKVIISDFNILKQYVVMLINNDYVLDEYFTSRESTIYGDATYRIHDKVNPFVFKFKQTNNIVSDRFIDYMRNYMFINKG